MVIPKNRKIEKTEVEKYHNVALKGDTYKKLLKMGSKNETFDQIVAKILKKKSEGQLIGLEPR